MVVHDFAYADICFDGYKPPSILQVEGAKEVAVEIFSMSKSYNMAGWRVGFCLGNPKMIAALARIKSYLDYGVFQPIQIASIIALRECEEDTQKICAMYQKRRDVLVDGLNARAGRWRTPKGSMFVWAPIPERFRAMGSLEFSKLLLEKALVAVSPGIGFGPLGEGLVRFALIENDHRTRQATAVDQGLSETQGSAGNGDRFFLGACRGEQVTAPCSRVSRGSKERLISYFPLPADGGLAGTRQRYR